MTLSKKNGKKSVLSYRDAKKKMIVVEIRGGKLSLCQVRNRSVQTGGSMGHRNLLATSFQFKQKNMTDVACFHGQHFLCLEGI